MEQVLDIYVREDDSVRKKLTDKAIKLQRKYYKKRKIAITISLLFLHPLS